MKGSPPMTRLVLMLSLLLSSLLGCSENPITTIDRTKDCAEICDKYKDCLSADYNTERCNSRCTEMKDSDETAKIDRCEACISRTSCSGSVFKCTADCVGIVP
jgi:hypothetical protein